MINVLLDLNYVKIWYLKMCHTKMR